VRESGNERWVSGWEKDRCCPAQLKRIPSKKHTIRYRPPAGSWPRRPLTKSPPKDEGCHRDENRRARHGEWGTRPKLQHTRASSPIPGPQHQTHSSYNAGEVAGAVGEPHRHKAMVFMKWDRFAPF